MPETSCMKRTSVHTKNMSMSVIFICTSYQVWLSIISDLDSRLSGLPSINLALIGGITKEKRKSYLQLLTVEYALLALF